MPLPQNIMDIPHSESLQDQVNKLQLRVDKLEEKAVVHMDCIAKHFRLIHKLLRHNKIPWVRQPTQTAEGLEGEQSIYARPGNSNAQLPLTSRSPERRLVLQSQLKRPP